MGACALHGQYVVNDGPPWGENPPTYTCREACALIFGGVPTDYACSTASTVPPNRQAFLMGYAADPTCNNIFSEDYKVFDTYSGPGAWSAYIQDHGCPDTNYCFTGTCP